MSSRKYNFIFLLIPLILLILSCRRTDDSPPDGRYPYQTALHFIIKFDSIQDRLDNNGGLSVIPGGHSVQTPIYNQIAINEIEFLEDSLTAYGYGKTLLSEENLFMNNGSLDLTMYMPGETQTTFHWLRIYFSYQNVSVKCKINGDIVTGTMLSFLKTHTGLYPSQIGDSIIRNDSSRYQGEWFLEVDTSGFGTLLHGQTPQGSLTQPNILHYSWPVQTNSMYVLTCPINPGLYFNKTPSKTITISVSTNKSFEWVEHSDPNYFEPLDGDTIIDFGIRGIKVIQ